MSVRQASGEVRLAGLAARTNRIGGMPFRALGLLHVLIILAASGCSYVDNRDVAKRAPRKAPSPAPKRVGIHHVVKKGREPLPHRQGVRHRLRDVGAPQPDRGREGHPDRAAVVRSRRHPPTPGPAHYPPSRNPRGVGHAPRPPSREPLPRRPPREYPPPSRRRRERNLFPGPPLVPRPLPERTPGPERLQPRPPRPPRQPPGRHGGRPPRRRVKASSGP